MSTRCDGPGVVALCCGTFVACGSKICHCCWDRNFTRPTAPMLIFIPTFAVSTLLFFHLHTSNTSTTNSSSLASYTTYHLSSACITIAAVLTLHIRRPHHRYSKSQHIIMSRLDSFASIFLQEAHTVNKQNFPCEKKGKLCSKDQQLLLPPLTALIHYKYFHAELPKPRTDPQNNCN